MDKVINPIAHKEPICLTMRTIAAGMFHAHNQVFAEGSRLSSSHVHFYNLVRGGKNGHLGGVENFSDFTILTVDKPAGGFEFSGHRYTN